MRTFKTLTVAVVLFFSTAFFAKTGFSPEKVTEPEVREWIKNNSDGFEENKGQFTDQSGNPTDFVLFKYSGRNLELYLTEKGFSYLFLKKDHLHKPEGIHSEDEPAMYSRVDIDLKDATILKQNIVTEDPIQTEFNYYNANAPRGITGVRKYQKITIRSVYPGIDWVWSFDTKKGLKYDFVVNPGADPSQIKLLYKWADLSLVNPKQLKVFTPVGELTEGKAVSFCDGKEINTNYHLENNLVSFIISSYDKSKTLTIDPPLALQWGTYFGGNSWEKNTDMSNAIDANGNVFCAGNTLSSSGNWPNTNPGAGAYYQGTFGGGTGIQGKGGDICILKFSNSGVLLWCTYYGGSSEDNGNSVAISPSGDVYVTGSSLSANLPTLNMPGAFFQGTFAGGAGISNFGGGTEGGDAVLLKFSNSGISLWGTFLGGSGTEVGKSVICDPAGNVYLTGLTASTNFTTVNPGGTTYFQGTNAGNQDMFITKFSSAGVISWSTYYGGALNDVPQYITLDPANNILITGETLSQNFPLTNPGGGAYFQATNAGNKDAFIFKSNNNGAVTWATYYGGSNADVARGITSTTSGEIYVCGQTASTNFPTLNPGGGAYFQGTTGGTLDCFYLRFQSSGVPVWATYFGGNANDDACAITADACGNIYSTGNTFSANMPTANPGGSAFFVGVKQTSDDVFFNAFSATTNAMTWSTFNGTTGFDEKGTSLKVDANGNLFIVGYWCFYSASNGLMNPGGGAYYKTNTDADDFFIAKITSLCTAPTPTCAFNAAGSYLCNGANTNFSLTVTAVQGYTPAPTFTWTGPGSFTSNAQNPTFPNGAFGTYTVTGGNANCTYMQTVTILNSLITPTAVLVANITCTNNGSAIANPTVPAGYTYSWSGAGISGSATQQSITVTNSGSFVVTITNPTTGCSAQSGVSITANVNVPTSSVNPVNQLVNCTTSTSATFSSTAISPSTNIVHNWYTPISPPPGPPAFSSNNQVSIFPATAGPGTYTVIVTDLTNGCSTTKTVNVTSTAGFPTFQTSSTTNYTIGCTPLHQTTLSIINAVTTTSSGAQYAFMSPGTSSTLPLPPGNFSSQSSTITATPGTWTFVVLDASNGCQTAVPLIILQDTISPKPAASMITQTLTCFNPTVLATATSTSANTTLSWIVPSTPPVIPSPTIIIGPPTGPNTHTTNLNYATYTVVATNTVNACRSNSVIVINQNFRVPTPSLAVGNPSVVNCTGQPVNLTYTNNAANSGIPGAVGVVVSWMGPAPQASASAGASYSVTIAGVQTLVVQDNKNGCYGSITYTVIDRTQPPVLTHTPNIILDCGSQFAIFNPAVQGGNAGHSFVFTNYPPNTAFSPLSAITLPGTFTSSIAVDQPGTYSFVVTNTVTGCEEHGGFTVTNGGLIADFTPSPLTGFAPLPVTFTNTSSSTLNSGTITSVWNFGNGTSAITGSSQTAATYTAPGSYTVMLVAIKGVCIDTLYKTIVVELPSALEIPNVFTPNGDGSNDVFFLKTAGLFEINALIYDRWGNKVYEVSSGTGNIAWDGKNLEGKDCADGTYFYIINAKGTDGKEYQSNGNVSIFR